MGAHESQSGWLGWAWKKEAVVEQKSGASPHVSPLKALPCRPRGAAGTWPRSVGREEGPSRGIQRRVRPNGT